MAYVILSKIKSTAHLESFIATEDLKNGCFIELGEEQEGEEIRLGVKGATAGKELVYHVSVPLTYEDRTNELDYVLFAGKEGRGYVLEVGNVVTPTVADGVTGVAVKGAKVKAVAEGFEVTEDVTGADIHGVILRIEEDNIAGKMAVIRINKA